MGMIKIETYGSFGGFGNSRVEFSAIEHGHAHAVGQAIAHLTELLHWSINTDHAIHEDGESPRQGFERKLKID